VKKKKRGEKNSLSTTTSNKIHNEYSDVLHGDKLFEINTAGAEFIIEEAAGYEDEVTAEDNMTFVDMSECRSESGESCSG
jgi:formylmethanofuran:tetrahydromethanopterin formyltransferase